MRNYYSENHADPPHLFLGLKDDAGNLLTGIGNDRSNSWDITYISDKNLIHDEDFKETWNWYGRMM